MNTTNEPSNLLADFLRREIGDDEARIAELSGKLLYMRTNIVRMWLEGKTKVPIHQLPRIAEFFDMDLSQLILKWVDQECPAELRPEFNLNRLAIVSDIEATIIDQAHVAFAMMAEDEDVDDE